MVKVLVFSFILGLLGGFGFGCEAQDKSAGVKERIFSGTQVSGDDANPIEPEGEKSSGIVEEPPAEEGKAPDEEIPSNEPGSVDDSVSGDDSATLLLQRGQELYADRCEDCHRAIAGSSISGVSEDLILGASGLDQHSGVTWPSADEAKALAAALVQ